MDWVAELTRHLRSCDAAGTAVGARVRLIVPDEPALSPHPYAFEKRDTLALLKCAKRRTNVKGMNPPWLVPPGSAEYVIDVEGEQLIPLSRPDHPLLRLGRRPNRAIARATLERWRTRGLRAAAGQRVALPTVLLWGQRFTSAEALRWFFGQLNQTGPSSAAVVRRAHRQAEAELAAYGL